MPGGGLGHEPDLAMRARIGGLITMERRELWGIDLGGTKIEAVVLQAGAEVPGTRQRLDTQKELGYDHIISRIGELIAQVATSCGLPRPARVGIGTPGTSDPTTGLHKNSNTTCLNGRPFLRDLADSLAIEVTGANDANCFALAEATLGAGRGFATVFGVIIGTGVGGGLVVNGQVLNGAMGIAGEWGHNSLEPDGVPCYCGKVGCVETVVAGPSLERFYFERTGVERSFREIVGLVDDPDAEVTRRRLREKVGEGLADVVNVFDPHCIVLGGGVGARSGFPAEVKEALLPWVFNPTVDTVIVSPELGGSAGVFGAAMLAA
jgi:fructokinase